MVADHIPDSVRRFVLTSIPTVPHLEALLLLWREPSREWPLHEIAARLYVPDATAAPIAEDLCRAGLIVCEGEPLRYRSQRESQELTELLDALDATYSRQLRAVTALIHSNIDRKAARFAQAFNWRKG